MGTHDQSFVLSSLPCPLCGDAEPEAIYSTERLTGTFFGRLKVSLAQCQACGFVFNSPRPDDAAMLRYYGEDALASGSIYRSQSEDAYYPKLFRERAEFYACFLKHKRAGALLDVGCGTGGFLNAISSAGLSDWSFHGLEPSERSAGALRAAGYQVQRGFLGDPLYPDQSFDAISLISVLEHLGDPAAAVEELVRMLKPGGLCLLEVPNSLQPELCLTGFFGLEHISHFSPGLLGTLFARFGLTQVSFDAEGKDNAIRLVASSDLGPWGVEQVTQAADDRESLRHAIQAYGTIERAFLQQLESRVQVALERWSAEGRCIAIYGAGAHTAELSTRFDLVAHASYLIDGDQGKQGTEFLGLPVIAPAQIREKGIRAVLLSSHRFVDEMQATVEQAGGPDVEIERCYGPEGSSDC